jgi:hypothetical protein
MRIIAEHPAPEMYASGEEIYCRCARCGSSVDHRHCDYCEDGFDGHDCGEDCCCCEFPEQNVPCDVCGGTGVWHDCMSSPDWCEANPLPGREDVPRGDLEWYTVPE